MKTRIIASFIAAVFMVLGLVPAARANQELLASAKSLYESASYEAALSELNAINSNEHVDVVDTYRALCLLGLGRTRDAERALEVIVTRRPLLTLSETEYSPRIVALFRDVRRRALPTAAQQLYSIARTDYENKNYEAAAAGFKQILQVIAEVEVKDQTATLADIKELAGGFMTLAETKVEAKAPAPRLEASIAPAVKPTVIAPMLYTLADVQVTPPVIVEQHVPAWRFASNLPDRVFRGRLELVVDETGAVETVTLITPIWPAYDATLVQAARKWRYQPAVKDGKPVKFRRILDINIDPKMQLAR
jgi:Gram-negative bacterial TonB protein C-terminal